MGGRWKEEDVEDVEDVDMVVAVTEDCLLVSSFLQRRCSDDSHVITQPGGV